MYTYCMTPSAQVLTQGNENIQPHKDECMNIHNSSICHSQNLETNVHPQVNGKRIGFVSIQWNTQQ